MMSNPYRLPAEMPVPQLWRVTRWQKLAVKLRRAWAPPGPNVWHVAVLTLLLTAIVVVHLFATDSTCAVVGVVSTIIGSRIVTSKNPRGN